ncbi:MAG TPA: hypothetical protein DC084_40245 [Cupriavidus sp.]|nr:hypothetical protein [Cupriavidus sp.]HBO77104.1 hypothetical protein [Cupriavidus sp.]
MSMEKSSADKGWKDRQDDVGELKRLMNDGQDEETTQGISVARSRPAGRCSVTAMEAGCGLWAA